MHCHVHENKEATTKIKNYVAIIERKFGRTPKYIRIDNEKELINKETIKWAEEKGIIIETTAPYSPSQNGGSIAHYWK